MVSDISHKMRTERNLLYLNLDLGKSCLNGTLGAEVRLQWVEEYVRSKRVDFFFFKEKKHSYEREQRLEIKRASFCCFSSVSKREETIKRGRDAQGQSRVIIEEALSQGAGRERIRAGRWR